jgi:hypothetical protein
MSRATSRHDEDARIARGLALLAAVEQIQADEADLRREDLVRAMAVVGLDPVPADTVAQARRLARERDRLLASGAYDMPALQRLRGDSKEGTTRTWLARRRKAGRVLTVSHDGTVLVPAFQLGADAEVLPTLAPVLAALTTAGLSGWAAWTWLTTATPGLDGDVPADLLARDPARVVRAAESFAAAAVA